MARTYYAFGRTWGEGARCEFAMRTLEETVYQHSLEIQFVALTLIEANDECDWLHKIFDEIFKGMWRGSIWSGIKELRQSLYEGAVLQRCSNFPIETEELLGMLDSLIQTLGYDMGTLSLNKLRESLEFLKKITLFAKFRGLEHRRMGDLFIHVQRLIVGVASLIFTSCSWPRDDEVDPLIETIKPVEYHGCRIYVRVLEEASKLQSSNCAPAGSHALILEMVESLIFLLLELFFSGTSYVGMFHHQMHTLYAGLRFLRNTLTVHRNKFEESYDGKMVNLVEVLICEAAMIVCYLCVKMPNNHVVEPLQHLFYEVDEKMKMIKETQGEAPRYPLKPTSCFPQTNLLGFIDSVLEKLDSFNLYECNPVVTTEKTKFLTIRKDMVFVRSFLIDFMGPLDQNEKVQALWSRVTAVVHEIEYVLDSLVIGDAIQNFLGMLNTILEQMKLVQNEAFEISRCVGQIPKVQNIAESHTKIPQAVNIPGFDEPKVELHDEVQKIIDRLTRGTKQLDVVSIVGMAGLGKTTLAKKVYRNPAIVYYFHDFVWCTISQVYDKKRLLLEVLMGLDNDFADKHSYMSEDDLADAIRRRLKRKRYLVILDDIWDIEAWGSLKLSFPDDAMGSRILLTSRNENVALQIGPKSQPFSLRLLTEKESWELFKMKIRFGEACPPPELVARGEAIVQRCKGLPLTIIIVAGLLSNMDTCKWDEVEEKLMKSSSSILEQCKETLELSYRHLPEYLKPCFLYFGAYKEDQRIRVRELLWLWIAEGFVERTGGECVEDVAECYLTELIQRNLVMIAETGSEGKVKLCILHDLLHEFCMAKSIGDHFLYRFGGSEFGTLTEHNMLYRLHIHSRKWEQFVEPMLDFPYLRTLFMVDDDMYSCDSRLQYSIVYKFSRSKLVRVLDLGRFCSFHFFPGVIQLLGHLKYLTLAVEGEKFILPPSIASLSNLETLFLIGGGIYYSRVLLPDTLWKMKNFRHLHCINSHWELPADDRLEHISILENLQTFSNVELSSHQVTKEVVRRFPNIRRFKCRFNVSTPQSIALDFLTQLESLSIYDVRILSEIHNDHYQFPHNLKKLTLQGLHLPWSKISMIDRLPNLEVLKLEQGSFIGEIWDMKEEGTFPKLRFLKLKGLDLARWTDSDDHFPCLQKLVLEDCQKLKELPSCLAEIPTIRMIEVSRCAKAIVDSIKQIRDTQMDNGNVDLEIRRRRQLGKRSYRRVT
ncbi:OLC1v1000593C1 [Oldenlandia corymbosa var. corymbosa]|uniref:OLC1v1000593C1 n=1 Tax=Oldenlandia corymbosa var. corymbosa TaxID=529605 RepID=A0AAV1D4R9_OLDCO|nr:OLC1v1000593C1 [Oldenlandia corymbosa var. corymbosa]